MQTVRIMIGLDCDRPRGRIIETGDGRKMAERKVRSLERISEKLDGLYVPRTYFICGQFLEAMMLTFGDSRIRAALSPDSKLCEIADHTYSHNVMKAIPTRPDKTPVSPLRIIEEYRKNTNLFQDIFKQDLSRRGLRAPLGHYQGISSEHELIALLCGEDVSYISSDLRDRNHSLRPPLIDENGKPRQPYRLAGGLVEVPSHGWQDTVFAKESLTPTFESYPTTYAEIIPYYRNLLRSAKEVAQNNKITFFLGLALHPYSISVYDPSNTFFDDLTAIAQDLDLSFCQYRSAKNYFLSRADL